MTLERDADGDMRTISTATFTVQQAAQEAEELLRALYQDETMLGLLRQRFSPEEAALYLEPGHASRIRQRAESAFLRAGVDPHPAPLPPMAR